LLHNTHPHTHTDTDTIAHNNTDTDTATDTDTDTDTDTVAHKLASILKGIKAVDLCVGSELLDIWNFDAIARHLELQCNECVDPKSVGPKSRNRDSSHSQHGKLIRLPGPEGLTTQCSL
jgi:hypothetical protein